MSATGRSGVRQENDFYETPAWSVQRLLERVDLPGGRWLAPCAGRGAIQRAVAQVRTDVTWLANELVEEHARSLFEIPTVEQVYVGDFMASAELARASWNAPVVLDNPPYRLAEAVLRRAWQIAPHALVALLLRLNFAASDDRAGLMQAHPPDIYVLPNRPSFRVVERTIVKDGREVKRTATTDATEYAWFIWEPATAPRRTAGCLQVLDTTPLELRRRARPPKISTGGPTVANGKARPLLPESSPPPCL